MYYYNYNKIMHFKIKIAFLWCMYCTVIKVHNMITELYSILCFRGDDDDVEGQGSGDGVYHSVDCDHRGDDRDEILHCDVLRGGEGYGEIPHDGVLRDGDAHHDDGDRVRPSSCCRGSFANS